MILTSVHVGFLASWVEEVLKQAVSDRKGGTLNSYFKSYPRSATTEGMTTELKELHYCGLSRTLIKIHSFIHCEPVRKWQAVSEASVLKADVS